MAIIFLIASILGIVPIAVWLMFFLWQDIKKPEPLRWLFILFGVGIIITPIVWYGEGLLMKFLGLDLNDDLSLFSLIIVYTGIAIIEELAKLFSARLALKKDKYFDEAIDAMIYLIVLALGFGLVENILAAGQEINTGNLLLPVLQIMSLRFIGANLLHALCSGLIGFFWALSLVWKKKSFLWEGIILGILLHASFNIAIIKFGGTAIFLVSLGLFLATICLLWAFDILKKMKKPIKF